MTYYVIAYASLLLLCVKAGYLIAIAGYRKVIVTLAVGGIFVAGLLGNAMFPHIHITAQLGIACVAGLVAGFVHRLIEQRIAQRANRPDQHSESR